MIKYMLLVAAICSLAFPAEARKAEVTITTICSERATLVGVLKKQYNEDATAGGLANTGGLVELLISPSGDTWTIIAHHPNGESCVLFAGENWRNVVRGKVL